MHTKDKRDKKWKGIIETSKKLDKARKCMHEAVNKGISSELEQRGLEICFLSHSFQQIVFEMLNEYRKEELEKIATLARQVR